MPHRSMEVDMTNGPRIPTTEVRGVTGGLAKWFSRRMLGDVPESLGVMWHHRAVLRDIYGLGRKADRWNACDKSLKSFAHMAVAAQVGCSFCLDFGYFMVHNENLDESSLPAALIPSEPDAPDSAYEKLETRARVRTAIQSLPWREQKVIGLYYYGEATMKQIGAEIGVNESRVSQLHARAVRRLREALAKMGPQPMAEMRQALVAFVPKPQMVKAVVPALQADTPASASAIVLPYKIRQKRVMPSSARPKIDHERRAVAAAL